MLKPGFSFGGVLESILSFSILETNSKGKTKKTKKIKKDDVYWMREALKTSLLSVGISNPNPAVGCILVSAKGKELARGFTQAYGGKHAERVAFDTIKNPHCLKGATAYITLEPCFHKGKQPACVDLLESSGIKRIVIARKDPHPLVCGKSIEKLICMGKQVEVGILKDEASAWNYPFLASQFLKRPLIALKWAQTLDGQLADDSNLSQWISSPSSRAYTHWLRQRYDAILVGAKTAIQDLPRLTVRDCALPHQSEPLAMVFDPKGICLTINKKTQKRLQTTLFNANRSVVYIVCEKNISKKDSSWMAKKSNILWITLPGKNILSEFFLKIKSPSIESFLGHPLQSILIEGGPKTLSFFLKKKKVDLIHAIVCPLITGGDKNRIHTSFLLKNALRYPLKASFTLKKDTILEFVSPFLNKQIFK